MRRQLKNGFELDDAVERIDRVAVHRFLADEAYWWPDITRDVSDELIDTAARVVGLYLHGVLVGYARVISDGHTVAYLADVYIESGYRGRGLGLDLVRFAVDEGPHTNLRKWLLHTRDAHGVYRKVGFGEPDERFMERWRS